MESCERTNAEKNATDDLLAFIETDMGDLPVKIVAGALMRASVALAVEVFGPAGGERATHRALRKILSQQRKLAMIGKKSLTVRAAEAVKGNTSVSELEAIRGELSQRIQEVDAALKRTDAQVETVMGDGDLDALRVLRQSEAELKDEDGVLHRLQADLFRAIKIAQGEEVMRSEAKHRKTLSKALEQAQKAQDMVQDSLRMARDLVVLRQHAAGIGEQLRFDSTTLRALASAIYPEGSNQWKQLLIDLGIRESTNAA